MKVAYLLAMGLKAAAVERTALVTESCPAFLFNLSGWPRCAEQVHGRVSGFVIIFSTFNGRYCFCRLSGFLFLPLKLDSSRSSSSGSV